MMEQVLSLAKTQGAVTRRDVEDLLTVSQATSNRLIKRMLQYKLLSQQGRGKNTRYTIAQ